MDKLQEQVVAALYDAAERIEQEGLEGQPWVIPTGTGSTIVELPLGAGKATVTVTVTP